MNPVDFTGRQIEVGYVIAYPVRRGSEMKLRSMTVEGIEIIRSTPPVYWLYGHSDKGRPVKVETPDRCIIIPGRIV
jgi:hypothetical protein